MHLISSIYLQILPVKSADSHIFYLQGRVCSCIGLWGGFDCKIKCKRYLLLICIYICKSYRITELLRLEKTSKIIKSNHEALPAMPTGPVLEMSALGHDVAV